MQNIENLLFFTGEDYLRVSKGLVRTIGVECAFMFAEFVDEYLYYYKEKYNTLEANNGWFFSTADNIRERTGWSADKQERIIQVLIEKCLIQKKVAGVPAKRFFYINTQKAQNLVNEYHETTFRKKRKLDYANNGNLITENSETIIRRSNKENLKTISNKDKDTASGLSQNENSVVKDSLITQKPKKEEQVEVIPNCIDISKWEEWKNYKKEKKQKLTKSTADKQLQNLNKWHLEGQDPNEIIDTSISNGWAGLFPLKQQKSTNNNNYAKPNATPTTRDFLRSYEKQCTTFDPTSDIE
jgi:hypothetical protein